MLVRRRSGSKPQSGWNFHVGRQRPGRGDDDCHASSWPAAVNRRIEGNKGRRESGEGNGRVSAKDLSLPVYEFAQELIDAWNRIKDFLPGREGHVGGTAADNRLFVEAVLFRYRTGVPWRDLPERFGNWKVVYQRFSRWAKSGVFERIFKLLASDPDNEYMMIDATIVRAHQHSAGARKKTARKRSADPAAD